MEERTPLPATLFFLDFIQSAESKTSGQELLEWNRPWDLEEVNEHEKICQTETISENTLEFQNHMSEARKRCGGHLESETAVSNQNAISPTEKLTTKVKGEKRWEFEMVARTPLPAFPLVTLIIDPLEFIQFTLKSKAEIRLSEIGVGIWKETMKREKILQTETAEKIEFQNQCVNCKMAKCVWNLKLKFQTRTQFQWHRKCAKWVDKQFTMPSAPSRHHPQILLAKPSPMWILFRNNHQKVRYAPFEQNWTQTPNQQNESEKRG